MSHEVFNIVDIVKRLKSIKEANKDIFPLLSKAENGDTGAREQLIEALMPFTYTFTLSRFWTIVNNLVGIDETIIQSHVSDVTEEGFLALVETVNQAVQNRWGKKELMNKLYNNIQARVITYVRAYILKINNEKVINTDANSYLLEDDRDVDAELVAILMKEEIVKTLSEYEDQDAVQLLYAYVGLHSLTFTELIEQMGIKRKDALKRVQNVMIWFRKKENII